MRLTCSTLSLFSLPPAEAIATIARLGFPALDLVGIPTFPFPHVDVARRDPAELEELAEARQQAGVEVASVVTVPSDGLGRWDEREIAERVRWAVAAAAAMSCARVVLDAGNPIPGERIERPAALARWKRMIDVGREATSAAGIGLAVEAPHTGTLAERFDQVQELLAVLDAPEVGLDYDTSHVHRSGTSTEDSLRLVGDRIVKVALRDVDARGEFCRPGTGRVDFAGLFELLAAAGYDGDVVLELETPGIEDPAGQVREIELAREYVEPLLGPR